MKKVLVLLLAILLISCFFACQNKNVNKVESESTKATESKISGAWKLNEKFNQQISDDDIKAFSKSMDTYNGFPLTPIVKLGTQVVSGQNMMFLCEDTTSTNQRLLKVAIVYLDLEGNAIITKVVDFDIEDYVPKDEAKTNENIAGGWSVNEELEAGKIDNDAKEAFDKALDGYASVGYVPIELLGIQVVSGINYAYLCKGTTVTEKPITSLSVLTVYKDTNGNSTINTICEIDLSKLDN